MRLLFGALLSSAVYAAAIQGTVVENQTGRPVARAAVEVRPISQAQGQPLSKRTDSRGQFELGGLAAGSYLVTATRRGFMHAEYGQRRWNSVGMPLTVQAEETAMITLRLMHYSAITGTVVDENEVGLPDFGVAVYRAGQPPELVASARGDESGVFRVSGLEPGTYLVRSAAKQDEDEAYLPTFSRETQRVEEARAITVYPEDETRGVEVHALPGKLHTLSGEAITVPPGIPVRITLASDMGRQTVEGPVFQFSGLAPGLYELFAEVMENPSRNIRYQAAYQQVPLDRDTHLRLVLQEPRETRFDFEPLAAGVANTIQVLARRKDLAGTAPTERLSLVNGRAKLAPGRWELLATPPAGSYVSGFSVPFASSVAKGRPDGWNEVVIGNFSLVRFSLSNNPGAIGGVVKTAGEPVAGAPVFLEAYDPVTRKRLTDLRTTRTDDHGRYEFRGLAPGTWRILATFEYQSPDTETMDAGGARAVQIDAGMQAQIDPDLYTLP